MEQNNKLVLFEDKPVRHIEHNGDMYFVVNDVIQILTDTSDVKSYWKNLTRKDAELREGRGKIYTPLSVETEGGKQKMNCANTEGVFRIIMSISSPKAEPFKQWLASVGKQTLDETENPELGIDRMIDMYKTKGYSDEWIKNRLQSIEIRKALTDEWQQRGVKEGQEYAILTATIAKETFGLSPSEHSNLKGLERQNLRDHMMPLELIFTALGEEMTRDITVRNDAQGFSESHEAATKGGSIAGNARRNVEKERGVPIVSSNNFLGLKTEENTAKKLLEDNKNPSD
jgi:DNA-damage-inducible protein D